MILHALNEYLGLRESTPGYAMKSLGFELVLDGGGAGCRLRSLYQPEPQTGTGKARMVAPTLSVPNVSRTVKVVPLLGCDNSAYVLGLPKPAKTEAAEAKELASAEVRKTAFVDLIRDYAEAATDLAATDFLAWHEAGRPGLDVALASLDEGERKRLAVDPIAVRSAGQRVRLHDSRAAHEFWGLRAVASRGGDVGLCLSCGQAKPVVATLPQFLKGSNVPGATQANVALLSANFTAASRGASGTGLRTAPICVDCATGAVQAFNELAADAAHRWSSRGDDQATIWWVKGEFDSDLVTAVGSPRPAQVRKIIDSVLSGREQGQQVRTDRFYALTFSGNVSRLVVRDWIDVPLLQVKQSIAAWFRDTGTPAIDKDTREGEPTHFPLAMLANSCGDFVRRDGKWIEVAPHGLSETLLRTALVQTPVPRQVLARALTRARAEIHLLDSSDALTAFRVRRRADARFALTRLILNRGNLKEHPLDSHLDDDRTDPAYLSGRLFAVRESLQYRALGKVNASITDRYFERASAHPASVDRALSALEQQHLKTLGRKKGEGAQIAMNKRIGVLHDRCGDAPGRMSVEEQAAWIAGYYQQRQADFAERTTSRVATESESD